MFSFNKQVRIVNRDRNTSGKCAASFCGRGLAEAISPSEIRLLESAEIQLLQRLMNLADRTVSGNFGWYVGDSGGSKIMKDGTGRGTKAGVSGGYRVLKANRGEDGSMTGVQEGESARKPSLDDYDQRPCLLTRPKKGAL